MKTWLVKGEWLHKATNKVHKLNFVVLTENNHDAVSEIDQHFDMSNMTYIRGEVIDLCSPTAICLSDPNINLVLYPEPPLIEPEEKGDREVAEQF